MNSNTKYTNQPKAYVAALNAAYNMTDINEQNKAYDYAETLLCTKEQWENK